MTSPTPTTAEALAACEKARAAFNAAAGEPKRGDRVRVTLEATFRAPNDVNGGVFIETDLGTYNIPQVVSVEVLRPPKPPEPTGAAALVRDRNGDVWARTAWGLWDDLTREARTRVYDDLDVVEVLRDGGVER